MTCGTSSVPRFRPTQGHAFAAPRSPSALRAVTQMFRDGPVYCYIVKTIKSSPGPEFGLTQTASAPNFEGGRITLCTCKHKDRATFRLSGNPDDPWKGVWVAGLTSKSEDPSRGLAYLMYVERSFLSQWDLWNHLPVRCRQAKSASEFKIGDLYEPKAGTKGNPHNPANYYAPIRDHSHAQKSNLEQWHGDIEQWGPDKPHRLLLGAAAQSYRWLRVAMVLKPDAMKVSAHHRKFATLDEFIANLKGFAR